MTDIELKNKQPSDEIDYALNKVFSSVSEAIEEKRSARISLDKIDQTLDALFKAINDARALGKKASVPNFAKILESDNA